MKHENKNKNTNKKKWLVLMAVGTALLLIPRRSSRQAAHTHNDVASKNKEKSVDDNTN